MVNPFNLEFMKLTLPSLIWNTFLRIGMSAMYQEQKMANSVDPDETARYDCLQSRQVNPFMPSGLFYLNSLDQTIYSLRDVWSVFIIIMFYGNACN